MLRLSQSLSLSLSAALCSLASAQCPNPGTWSALGQASAPQGSVYAMVRWDPDGPGPIQEHFVCGGEFQVAGASLCRNIALYDPITRTWSAFQGGFDGPVYSLLVTSGNELIVGGDFTSSGSTSLQNIARWAVGGWLPLGPGISGTVGALVEQPSGDIVAGGDFPVGNIARWDGLSWNAIGGGVQATPAPYPPAVWPITDIVVRGNELVVSGAFSAAGGAAADGAARWDGTSWSAVGLPAGDEVVTTIGLTGGDVLFSVVGASGPAVRRWDGMQFTTLGVAPEPFSAMIEMASGAIVGTARDGFSAFGVAYEWSGAFWQSFASNGRMPSFGEPRMLVEAVPGELVVATTPYGFQTSIVELRNGAVEPLGAGLDNHVERVIADGDRFIAAGFFSQVGAVESKGIAVLTNNVWQPLGSGFEYVQDVIVDDAGDLVAVGVFGHPFSANGSSIARWDGSSWQSLPLPSTQPAFEPVAVEQADDGDLIAVSVAPAMVARWDGSGWSQVGAMPSGVGTLRDVVELPNGDLVVVASGAGTLVAHWNGSVWTPLAGGPNGAQWGEVRALHVEPSGDLLCGGYFTLGAGTQPYGLARWDGVNWTPITSIPLATVVDIDELPTGELLITQSSGQGLATPVVLSGSAAINPGIVLGDGERAYGSAVNTAGEVLVMGTFATVNGVLTGGVARYRSACPALAASAGSGCSSSAGPVAMTIESRAWLGGTFRSRTTGVPASALALPVFGSSSSSLPLQSVLPQALPSCSLHVSPDVLWIELPQGGEVLAQWTLPSAPALLSQAFLHQIVVAELGGSGGITEVSSSNAQQLVIGAW